MSSGRRSLPIINGRKSRDDAGDDNPSPGGDDVPKKPPNEEVPQESSDDEEESSDEDVSSVSSEESSNNDGAVEDNPMNWTKETLVRSIKFAEQQFNALKRRFQKCQDINERLENTIATTKVKHQVVVSTLRNKVKTQYESKAAVRQSFENKYREDLDLLKQKVSHHKKRSSDLARNLAKVEKDAKQYCTEKDIARRKLSTVNLDYVEKNKEVMQLKLENKKLKKEVEKKAAALERMDEVKIQARLQIEREKTERKKILEKEKTARKLMDQQQKESEHEKKKDLAKHNAEIRMYENREKRKDKLEEEKAKLEDQKGMVDTHLSTMMRSAVASRTTLPNNGHFYGGNQLIQQQHPSTPANNLPSVLLQLGGGGSGSSNDDAISLVTQPPQPPALMSPPANRQLTLTQMERERTPEQQPLPHGVQKLTDDASGETYYMMSGRDGSKSFYMSYDELMDAMNSKTGESTIQRRRDWRTETTEANITAAVAQHARGQSRSTGAATVTPATTFDSQMSDLTMTQQSQSFSQSFSRSLDSAACESETEDEEEEF